MNNRILKAFAPLLLASLILQPTAAFALQGGPFDGGRNPGASAGGTYAGVLTGKNLIGMTQFGISNSAQATGRFVVFHEGILSYGLAEAIADPGNGRLAGMLIGLALLPGEDENPSVDDGNAFIDVAGRGSAEGAWTAEMKGFPIAITFEGKGEIATMANPVTVTTGVTVPNAVTITGGGTADGTNGPGGQGTEVQSVTATTDATIFSTTLRATTPFRIRGSRTSLTNYTAITNFDGTNTIAPTNP